MAFYGNRYSAYESEREVDNYATGYNTFNGGCVNSGLPVNQHRHNMVSDVVCETDVVVPRYGRHHHGGAVEYVERDERIVYENDSYAADPCRVRRPYC
ncbi:hypothetical protein RND81_06G248400 [Saponaria officinalis]|uniref:Uncharacterized protein n=1 Tax=Saponaria officinalis TaxID=3572 RepID=A0AAW1KG43_SAPOF